MKNKVGIYYAYWTHDWKADYLPFVAKVKNLGFDVLEVHAGPLVELGSKGRARLREQSAAEGIQLSACIGLSPAYDIASSSSTTRKDGVRYLNSIADAIKECGIDRVSGILYSTWLSSMEGRKGTKAQAFKWSTDAMREAIKKAEDNRLYYNIEVVNRFEQFLINTADEAVEYVETVGSPNLKILLDTYHMNIEEDTFAGAIRTAGKHLGHFHIGENNRKTPGHGHIPWKEIGKALKEIRYSEWVVMEPFLMPGGEVGRDIRVNREVMPGADLDGEARKACTFTRAFLR
jgi:D-psicose/D-tagatose/L-ribulose 3-epimerase